MLFHLCSKLKPFFPPVRSCSPSPSLSLLCAVCICIPALIMSGSWGKHNDGSPLQLSTPNNKYTTIHTTTTSHSRSCWYHWNIYSSRQKRETRSLKCSTFFIVVPNSIPYGIVKEKRFLKVWMVVDWLINLQQLDSMVKKDGELIYTDLAF